MHCAKTQIKAAPLLQRDEEHGLALAAKAGSPTAFDRLVRAYVPLVYSIVRELNRTGAAVDDLVGEGLLGLVEATRRFDPSRGVRLGVYASFWIRAYVRRYTIFNRRIVRPPSSRGSRRVLAHLRSVQATLRLRDGEEPSCAAIASALAVSRQHVEEIVAVLGNQDVAYDVEGERGSVELGSDASSPEALVAEREEQTTRSAAVQRALAELSLREQEIIRRRDLADARASLHAIGEDLGVSRERVRQLEFAARDKMRSALSAHA